MPQVISAPVISNGGGGGGQGGMDLGSLLGFALQMRRLKMSEEEQKKMDALQRINLDFELAQKHGVVAREVPAIQKDFGVIGMDKVEGIQKFAKQLNANQAGAQSATPPSKDAQNRAPGGGTVQGGLGQQVWTALQSEAAATMEQQQIAGEKRDRVMGAFQTLREKRGDRAATTDALTTLVQEGAIPWDKDMFMFSVMNDQQREDAIAVAAGAESKDAKAQRSQKIYTSLVASNPNLTPEQSRAITENLVNNTPIPPELETKVSDLQTVTREAGYFQEYSRVLPAKAARTAAQATARGISIDSVLPEGVKTIPEMQLELGQQQLALDRAKLGAMNAENLLRAKQLEQDLKKNDREDLLARINMFVSMKKSGVDMDATLERELLSQIASSSGMKIEEVKHWRQYVTGGSDFKFTSQVQTEDQKKLDAAAGKPPAEPDKVKFMDMFSGDEDKATDAAIKFMKLLGYGKKTDKKE